VAEHINDTANDEESIKIR